MHVFNCYTNDTDCVQAKETFLGKLIFFFICSYLGEKTVVTNNFENRCAKLYRIFNAVGTKFCGQAGGYLCIIKQCGKNCGYMGMWLHNFRISFP